MTFSIAVTAIPETNDENTDLKKGP